jgi:hypothetical protein
MYLPLFARWYIFIPIMTISVYIARPWAGHFGVFHGHLVYLLPFGIFMAIWYFCGYFVIFFHFGLLYQANLSTLVYMQVILNFVRKSIT